MNTLIHEIADELHLIIVNINRAFVNGDLDHLPDPLEERDRLINQVLLSARMPRKEEE